MGLVTGMVLRRSALSGVLAGLCLALGMGCASSSTDNGFFYEVKKGETLYSIGRRYEVHHERLRQVNKIADAAMEKGEGAFL